MSTTSPEGLTKKQQIVYEALDRGKDVPTIARQMKITQSGVFGHMRKMREKGVELPNERIGDNDDPPADPPPLPPAASNGTTDDPASVLRAAIERGSARVAEIQAEKDQLTQREELLEAERKQLEEQQRKFASALEQLA